MLPSGCRDETAGVGLALAAGFVPAVRSCQVQELHQPYLRRERGAFWSLAVVDGGVPSSTDLEGLYMALLRFCASVVVLHLDW